MFSGKSYTMLPIPLLFFGILIFSFFKKKTLLNFPFDEIHPGKEDRFWVQELIQNKGTYLYDPRLEINHFYTEGGATWKGIG